MVLGAPGRNHLPSANNDSPGPRLDATHNFLRTVSHGGHLRDVWHRQQIFALIHRFLGPCLVRICCPLLIGSLAAKPGFNGFRFRGRFVLRLRSFVDALGRLRAEVLGGLWRPWGEQSKPTSQQSYTISYLMLLIIEKWKVRQKLKNLRYQDGALNPKDLFDPSTRRSAEGLREQIAEELEDEAFGFWSSLQKSSRWLLWWWA